MKKDVNWSKCNYDNLWSVVFMYIWRTEHRKRAKVVEVGRVNDDLYAKLPRPEWGALVWTGRFIMKT